MCKHLYLLFISILISLAGKSNAQYIEMNESLQHALGLVMELKLTKATALTDSLSKIQKENKGIAYIKAIIVSNKLLLQEDKNEFDAKRESLEKFIEEISKVSDDDPQKRKMMGEIHLAIAILHAKYQNNIRAGLQFFTAYNLLKDNFEKFPNHHPNYIALGVLYSAIGSLPEGYQSIASLFGMSGSVEEGMALVHKGYWRTISEKENRFYREYYGFIYAYSAFTIQGRTDVSLSSLAINFKKGSNLIYLQSLIDIQKGQAHKAYNYLQKRPKGDEYEDYPFMDYHTGKVAIAFSTDTAKIYLKSFLKNTPDDYYIKSAYRYLSWCAMLEGDKKALDDYRKLVLTKGSLKTGADKQAQKEAESNFNEVLIRGRILFDGGRYKDAIKYMMAQRSKVKAFNQKDKLEFHYRLGRIYQEDKQNSLAIREFVDALGLDISESSFAQGNSALQLARVYEEQGNKDLAKTYYEKTLSIQGFPFYEGLHQQAKAGLDRL
tara:strand:+ start:53643 stop:55118 length:1476 start_codon:yes stop_codon:yes gene_type:complete